MVTRDQIQKLADQIAAEFRPQKIILFGSRAYGTPGKDSDVDLMVIEPLQGSPVRRAVEMLSKFDPPFSVDLRVRDPEDVAMRYEHHDTLIRDVLDRGHVLYAEAA